jgi:hypothetical protein
MPSCCSCESGRPAASPSGAAAVLTFLSLSDLVEYAAVASRTPVQRRPSQAKRPADSRSSVAGRIRSLSRSQILTIVGISLYVLASALLVARYGFFIHSDEIFIWVLVGLFALSLSDLRRFGLSVVFDWLPLGLLLLVYDTSRGVTKWLGLHPHHQLQISFDEFFFGKPLLSVRLQHLLHQTRAVRWWEYPMWATYMTFFFLGLVTLAVLWRFSYPRFRQFRAQYIVLNTFGFATYVLYPADPPWLVSQRLHLLPTLYRPVFEVWGKLGVNTANAVVERGPEFGNLVSAVPSMHAAVSMFVCLFFWPRARAWVRALMVLYVLAMATTLVYGAEHYFFDIVVGWSYAVLVIIGTALLRRWRGTTDANLPTAPGRRTRKSAPDAVASAR